MPEAAFEIRPRDDDALRAALVDARRGPGQARPVSALVGGLVFQFSDAALLGAGSELSGPYCQTCRKALFTVSYTEWSTADRGEAAPFEACPHCARPFSAPGSMTELRRAALAALDARLDEVGLARRRNESE